MPRNMLIPGVWISKAALSSQRVASGKGPGDCPGVWGCVGEGWGMAESLDGGALRSEEADSM
jgi:hypothetical protein